jgi:hypothetical protein
MIWSIGAACSVVARDPLPLSRLTDARATAAVTASRSPAGVGFAGGHSVAMRGDMIVPRKEVVPGIRTFGAEAHRPIFQSLLCTVFVDRV